MIWCHLLVKQGIFHSRRFLRRVSFSTCSKLTPWRSRLLLQYQGVISRQVGNETLKLTFLSITTRLLSFNYCNILMINNMHCNYRLQYVHVFLTNASDVFSYSVFLAFCLVATLTKKCFFFF